MNVLNNGFLFCVIDVVYKDGMAMVAWFWHVSSCWTWVGQSIWVGVVVAVQQV